MEDHGKTERESDMGIHAKFLIHWTGGTDIEDLDPSTPAYCEAYVDRLKSMLDMGLFMPVVEGKTHGQQDSSIQAGIACVCFTEIRLSQANEHAERYGKLGIGFSRSFVMERRGNPVFYVQNGKRGIAVENLAVTHGKLRSLIDSGQCPESVMGAFDVVLSLVKGMSERDSDELKYYEEMEWRILHSDSLERQGVFRAHPEHERVWCMPFTAKDVAVLVFPNSEIKEQAFADEEIRRKLFGQNLPIVATLDDCSHF